MIQWYKNEENGALRNFKLREVMDEGNATILRRTMRKVPNEDGTM